MHQAWASAHENVTVKVTGKWVKNVVCGLYVHGGICGASAGRGRTPKLLGTALFNFRKAPDIHLALLIKLAFLAVQDSSIGDLVTHSLSPSVRDF